MPDQVGASERETSQCPVGIIYSRDWTAPGVIDRGPDLRSDLVYGGCATLASDSDDVSS